MNQWKVILATVLIFGSGVVTGALVVHKSQRTRHTPPASNLRFQPVSASGLRVDFLKRAQRELDLTPEQRARIEHILAQSQQRSKRLMEPVAPAMRDEVRRVKAEFREVLTPEQKTTFDKLFRQQQRPKENPSGPGRDLERREPRQPKPQKS